MFWKFQECSVVMLINGFILLRGGLIYTYADTDAYILTFILSVTVKSINE